MTNIYKNERIVIMIGVNENVIIIGDPSETDIPNRRPIRDRHALSESLHYSNINKQKLYINKYI